jgi:hypothetical protein
MVNVVCWFAGVSRPAREGGKGEGSLVLRGNFSRLIAVRLDAPGTRAEDGVATFAASYRASRRARPPVERIELEFQGGEWTTYRRRTPRRGWGSCPCCWCTRTRRRTRLRGTPWRGRCGCERGAWRRSCERRDDFSECARARERFRAGRAVVRARRRGSSEERASRSRDGCLDVVKSRRTTTTARVNDREARRRVRGGERTRREGLDDEACRCFLGERRGAWECGASW